MDCTAVLAEVQANNGKVQQLASDQGLKTAQNIVAGTAGFVIPVLWFGMDWQGTADKETQALQARQQYLAVLAEQKRCGVEAAPDPAPAAQAAPRAKKPTQGSNPQSFRNRCSPLANPRPVVAAHVASTTFPRPVEIENERAPSANA